METPKAAQKQQQKNNKKEAADAALNSYCKTGENQSDIALQYTLMQKVS